MPRLARFYAKSALLYLIAALLLGVALEAGPSLRMPGWLASFRSSQLHMLVVGWITQMIFAVAYWMFPKLSLERPRGSEPLGWATFVLLNLGLLLRIWAEPAHAQTGGSALTGWALVISALLQWVAGLLFIINIWGRVRER